MKQKIQQILRKALDELDVEHAVEIRIERSKHAQHGHFSTNLAMMLARPLRRPPIQIAQDIVHAIAPQPEIIRSVEVKQPGFINFFLAPGVFQAVVKEIEKTGENYGRADVGKGKRAQVEFVSANPTGPLTVGHGRQAVLGDTIARILEWNGYRVDREYYYNDAGRQMRILGRSVYLRYRQLLGHQQPFPEDHYQGEYIVEIARNLVDKYGNRFEDEPDETVFKEAAEDAVFKDIRETLQLLGIQFDRYYNEKSLYDDGLVEEVLQKLAAIGATYEKDGAVWFRAGEYGAGEDRVLWKSVADEATYRLPDIAYHTTKFKRGYELIVDVFGADHHATYPDVMAGLKALGHATERVRVLIHQFVTLTRSGEKIKMSTRKANYVTLSELIDEVGRDVVRYFFIMRGMQSHLNFDLTLAKTEGEENPVYYLQYAHARIASILRNARFKKYRLNAAYDPTLLKEPETLELLNILGEFPEASRQCGETLEPQQITTYLQKLATAFHKFYTEQRVLTEDKTLSHARLALVKAVKTVMAIGLGLIGVTAPERM